MVKINKNIKRIKSGKGFDEKDLDSLKQKLSELNSLNEKFIQLCRINEPNSIGFDIEKVLVSDEDKVKLHGIRTLEVTPLLDWTTQEVILTFWNKFIKADGLSTKYVDRLPGIVIITSDIEIAKEYVNMINSRKAELADFVRKDRDAMQKHEFIHTVTSGLMTEQVYRKIHIFEHEVTNIWFNWASRPVPKKFKTLDEVVSYLESAKERLPYLENSDFWIETIDKAISAAKSGKYDYFQKLREFRVFPTIEFQYIDKLGNKKRKKVNATTPFLLLGQVNKSLPRFSPLKNYVAPLEDKSLKLSNGKTLICDRLNLVGCMKPVISITTNMKGT